MRLRVIVDRLKLTKENLEYGYGKEFEVPVERGIEILKTTFNGNPVVEFVSSNENPKTDAELIAKNAELEAQVTELTEAKDTLIVEKAALENRVKELEEANETPENEGEEENKNKKGAKKEGEDK